MGKKNKSVFTETNVGVDKRLCTVDTLVSLIVEQRISSGAPVADREQILKERK